MASAYMPVETILKVDDNEILSEENKNLEQSASLPSNYVSIGTQYDWKLEQPENKSCNLLHNSERSEEKLSDVSSEALLITDKTSNDSSMVIRNWSMHSDPNILSAQKILMPTTFSQQFTCDVPPIPGDEKFFLQFDYKTRNKFKTKQRRLDPFYRSQERVRQRTVMRIKRQDPGFRAAEREKGRYRMRMKRLDPEFRSQERERQRERMKVKRSDPEFREKEREQQKNRLHVKRQDPTFKEKERAQDRQRMRMKRQNNIYTNLHSGIKMCQENENASIISGNKVFKDICKPIDVPGEFSNNQSVFPENFNSKLLSIKPRESMIETFHFKKQHIINFNFYNTNKEQWSHELSSRTITHLNDLNDSNILQNASLAEVNIDLLRRNSLNLRKSDLKIESSSEPLLNIKSCELSLVELQRPKCPNNLEASLDHKFSLRSNSDV